MILWELLFKKLEEIGIIITEATKVGIEHFYPLALQRAVIIGWLDLGTAFLLGIFIIIAIIFLNRLMKKEDRYNDHEATIFFLIFSIVVATVFICVGICTGIIRILNPEWYAVKEIINLVE